MLAAAKVQADTIAHRLENSLVSGKDVTFVRRGQPGVTADGTITSGDTLTACRMRRGNITRQDQAIITGLADVVPTTVVKWVARVANVPEVYRRDHIVSDGTTYEVLMAEQDGLSVTWSILARAIG